MKAVAMVVGGALGLLIGCTIMGACHVTIQDTWTLTLGVVISGMLPGAAFSCLIDRFSN